MAHKREQCRQIFLPYYLIFLLRCYSKTALSNLYRVNYRLSIDAISVSVE